ncbi:MAG: transposase family protein [Thermodesulfovibrionales bacterium]
MNRQYLAYLLRNSGKKVFRRGKVVVVADPTLKELSKRGRKKIYGRDVDEALSVIWPLTGFASYKHLVAFIRFNWEMLFKHEKLSLISEKTKEFEKLIRIEPWFDRSKEVGTVEIDLAHHSEASGKGEFIYTLTATEIVTGWTELRTLKNKAMVWTRQALEEILRVMPVSVKKIHSDNGSECINAHVQRFCRESKIEFTRSRTYRKNDAPYVESKNWSLVRSYVGWRRYDTEEELRLLDRLLKSITIRHNLFMPHMRLVYKEKEGGKVRKSYEMEIPVNRVLKLIED